MAKPEEIAKKTAEKFKGKKAKLKKVSAEPEGTKGKTLSGPMKAALEDTFGCDFSKVRIHTGGNAGEIADELGARAFTMGPNIFFKSPSDAANPKLIAHEAWHVVQQAQGRIPKLQAGKALVSK
jgi:hypothetical protein